jgi:hypothetical protein
MPAGIPVIPPGGLEARPQRNPQGQDRLPPTPPRGGQTRAYVRTLPSPVARNNAVGTYTDRSVSVYVGTPDPRLLATVTFGFREEGRDYPSIAAPYAGHVVNADLFIQTQEGRWIASNHVFDLTQSPASATFRAPWSYRWADSPGRLVCKLTVPAGGTALGVVGDWWASVEWDLAPGAWIADEELARLFAACQFEQLTGAIVVSNTGAP